MSITEEIDGLGEIPPSNEFAGLRSGMYKGGLVAVKAVRATTGEGFLSIRKVSINVGHPWHNRLNRPAQRFFKGAILWSTLSHPNILILAGVQMNVRKRQLATVSEWMVRGNIMEYIKSNHANRLELVRDFAFPVTSFADIRR